MRRTRFRMIFATVAALALVVGVGGAIAANGKGGPTMKQEAARIAERAGFEAAVAKSLGTTAAKLNAAIKASALANIDAALAAKEITADEAATLKAALAEGMHAMRFATAAGVAKELGTTEAKLNAAFSDAHKAQAKARVDQALKDGKITEAYAKELKAQIDAATFPGFGAGGPGHHGGKGGPGGRGGHGPGMGFGIPGAGGSSGGSSSTPASARAFA